MFSWHQNEGRVQRWSWPDQGAGTREVGGRLGPLDPHFTALAHICFELQSTVTQFQSFLPVAGFHLVCLRPDFVNAIISNSVRCSHKASQVCIEWRLILKVGVVRPMSIGCLCNHLVITNTNHGLEHEHVDGHHSGFDPIDGIQFYYYKRQPWRYLIQINFNMLNTKWFPVSFWKCFCDGHNASPSVTTTSKKLLKRRHIGSK